MPGRHMQPCRARLQRTQHDAVPRQNQPAQKLPLGIHGFHRHRRAHHHHHQGARPGAVRAALQHAVPGTDHRHPAVRAQAGGNVVAVVHPRLLGAGHHPAWHQIGPDLHLLHHPALERIARHHTAQHPVRHGQILPRTFGQAVDVLQELRSVGNQRRIRPGLRVQGPFQAGVADVDGKETHRRDYAMPVRKI